MTTSTPPRIGLIVPASNTATEVQFQRYAPAGVGVHTTRLRMTGKWQRPLREMEQSLHKPVVTSNQAVLWSALRRIGIPEPVAGLGRLSQVRASAAAVAGRDAPAGRRPSG